MTLPVSCTEKQLCTACRGTGRWEEFGGMRGTCVHCSGRGYNEVEISTPLEDETLDDKELDYEPEDDSLEDRS